MTDRPMTEETPEQLATRVVDTWGEGNPPIVVLARALLSTSASLRKMREALEPFAKIADWYHDSEDGSHEIWVDAHERATRVTVGMCKAARAALSGIEPESTAPKT